MMAFRSNTPPSLRERYPEMSTIERQLFEEAYGRSYWADPIQLPETADTPTGNPPASGFLRRLRRLFYRIRR